MPSQSTPASKDDLNHAVDRISAELHDVAQHFNATVGHVNDELHGLRNEVHAFRTETTTKLDAIMESVAVRKEVRELVRQLHDQGVQLDDAKIFAA